MYNATLRTVYRQPSRSSDKKTPMISSLVTSSGTIPTALDLISFPLCLLSFRVRVASARNGSMMHILIVLKHGPQSHKAMKTSVQDERGIPHAW
ncbi:hypothetical protein C8Q80DRAFT_1211286 [Daedaleopsis nitida]|nr:hypothetical protein C8Q80DRAFT_1211286 [Daedaleopsis nitida]